MNGTAQNPSSNSLFRALTWLQWAILPVIGGLYAISWNQLPAHLATHFDFSHHPNGWMSREGSLIFTLVLATLFAITGTWILARIKKPDAVAWALLALMYVILWTLLWATDSIIGFNTSGRPVNVLPVLITGISAAVVVVVLALTTRRGKQLPPSAAFAEETHASPAFAVVLGIPAAGFILLASKVPVPALRVVFGLSVLMMIFATAMAWNGFHYFFSPAGVDIRTLGFRLRSIPAADIRRYAIDRWSIAGGYGIRGVGNRRAYVWGNRGVKIETQDGEVFLGHSEPEKIVRDLDLLTNHQGHEAPRRFS